MRHHHFGQGRYVLRLDPGEEVVSSLKAFAQEAGIEAGYVTGLGSVDMVVLGFLDREGNEYVRRRFEERMEVGSLTGSFSREGERPYVHVHMVVAPQEMLAYTGHVHEARVAVLLELFVTALPGRLSRIEVPGKPFPVLRLPGEESSEGDAASR